MRAINVLYCIAVVYQKVLKEYICLSNSGPKPRRKFKKYKHESAGRTRKW